jgi:hypothetical protein
VWKIFNRLISPANKRRRERQLFIIDDISKGRKGSKLKKPEEFPRLTCRNHFRFFRWQLKSFI